MEEHELTVEEQKMVEEHGLVEKSDDSSDSEESQEESKEESENDSQESKDDSEESQEDSKESQESEDNDKESEEGEKPDESEKSDLLDDLVSGKEIADDEENKRAEKLTPKERGFYYRTKKEIAKRRKALERADYLQVQHQAEKAKRLEIEEQLAKLKEEDGEEVKKEPENKQQNVQDYIRQCDTDGQARYDDYQEMTDLAEKFLKEDPASGRYAKRLDNAVHNMFDTPGEKASDMLYEIGLIAKSKGYKLKEEKKEEEKPNKKADRIIKNSKKRPSSASVGGEGKPGQIPESDLTLADVAGWSQDKWATLKPETRERLMYETCKVDEE